MCSFCNQKTISGTAKKLTKEDIDNAVKIATAREYDKANSEIAFFGGSFTAIDKDYITYLLESAYPYVEKGLFKGIRCSTRPDAINEEILVLLKKYGVTAIELGAQSMSDKVLEMNNRGHTAQDVINATNLIKKHGFECGLQMMTGLYGDTYESVIETAEKIISLKPDTVRIYPTVVLENTRLAELFYKMEYFPLSVNESVEICSRLLGMFNDAGIKVIRLGLHSGGNVEEGFVAGAYHPAFRELCESRLYFEKCCKIIKDNNITLMNAKLHEILHDRIYNKEKRHVESYIALRESVRGAKENMNISTKLEIFNTKYKRDVLDYTNRYNFDKIKDTTSGKVKSDD